MPEQVLWNLVRYHGTWVHLNGVFHISVSSTCVSVVYPPIVVTQRLRKTVTAATNTDTTIEELLDASSSTWSVTYQGKIWLVLPRTSCNIKFPSTPSSPIWSLFMASSHENERIYHSGGMCYMPRPPDTLHLATTIISSSSSYTPNQ
jgi:hypothetical protein